ncbi:MAG: dockerin type I repeat-containing protein [Oscillospiraceae bacterium]|nr:dockerin type I repeat-containing protein [Oscillospiraceae bacterium]
MKKFQKQMLSVLLSLSVAGGVFLPVGAKAASASVYPAADAYSYNAWMSILFKIKDKISNYVEEQKLTVKEIRVCRNESYNREYNKFYGYIHEYSVLVVYDSAECPQVETAIREYMEEIGLAEEYLCFYDVDDKIRDKDVIYTMISEYVEEEDIEAFVYHPFENSDCGDYVTLDFVWYSGAGEAVSKFMAENNIDVTQVCYSVADLAGPELEMGDPDGDGEVGILDVVLMNRVVVGVERMDESQRRAADVDGDGKLTLSDSMKVLQYIVGLITEL